MAKDIRYVEGINHHFNHIILQRQHEYRKNVIYFGGDVQNFEKCMLEHRDNARYSQWSLEKTVDILTKKFEGHNIWVIVPASYYLKTFAAFTNFVESDKFGVPKFQKSLSGIIHLIFLLHNFSLAPDPKCDTVERPSQEKIEIHTKTAPSIGEKTDLDIGWVDKLRPIFEQEWKVVAFSKGCAVLNQLIYSFSTLPLPVLQQGRGGEGSFVNTKVEDAVAYKFLRSLRALYWLDGGHSGGKDTWITDKEVLKRFTTNFTKCRGADGPGAHVEIHVTPYQIKCPTRPWIGREEKVFSHTLQQCLTEVSETSSGSPPIKFLRRVHYETENPGIDLHFQILKDF